MARCAAFLRGINITDRRIKGEVLRSVFEAMGFREVREVLVAVLGQ